MPPHIVWDYTPRELHAGFAGFAHARNMRRKDAHEAAWFGGYYGRIKKLPNLNNTLAKFDPPKEMSANGLRNAIIGLAKALGAKVTYVKRGQ